jgi:hypothetical protein
MPTATFFSGLEKYPQRWTLSPRLQVGYIYSSARRRYCLVSFAILRMSEVQVTPRADEMYGLPEWRMEVGAPLVCRRQLQLGEVVEGKCLVRRPQVRLQRRTVFRLRVVRPLFKL